MIRDADWLEHDPPSATGTETCRSRDRSDGRLQGAGAARRLRKRAIRSAQKPMARHGDGEPSPAPYFTTAPFHLHSRHTKVLQINRNNEGIVIKINFSF